MAAGDAPPGSDEHFAGPSNESLVDFCARIDELDCQHETLVGRQLIAARDGLTDARL